MRKQRLDFRTSHQERMQFEMRATYLVGVNQIASEGHALLLSDRDRNTFLSALENPPSPNKNLKKAFSEYKKIKK